MRSFPEMQRATEYFETNVHPTSYTSVKLVIANLASQLNATLLYELTTS